MHRASRALAAVGLLSVLVAGRAHAITADSADDVCPADADLCNVTDVVEVAPGATLDFGNRSVRVTGSGRFDFGSGSGQILTGPFEASTTGDAIVARGPGGSGTVTILARRLCSAGSPQAACLGVFDCQLGTCAVRRCSGRPTQHCDSDAACAGVCNSGRCSNTSLFTRCTSNADCNFGTCPEGLTCSSNAQIRSCSANADCDLGSCTVGQASMVIDGSIDGKSDSPAKINLRAADSLTIRAPIDLSATDNEADGGLLGVHAEAGDILLTAGIRAKGGGLGAGGSIRLDGAGDVTVSGPIDVSGGAYDGGELEATAGQDVVLQSDINMSAKAGSGYGGSLTLDAGRDVRIGSGTDSMRILANGHTDHVDSGDGGYFQIDALGDVLVAPGVRIFASGLGRDAFGGFASIYGDGAFEFDGQFYGRARGSEGPGGTFEVYVTGGVTVGPDARFDLRGAYGGTVDLYSEEGDTTLGGSVRLNGSSDLETGSLKAEACNVTVSGKVNNKVIDGLTTLIAHGNIHLLPGSELLTPNGDTTLVYGSAENPPVLEGTIDSTLHLELQDYGGCPVCGNGVLELDEGCDDGNTVDGDGCNSDCGLE